MDYDEFEKVREFFPVIAAAEVLVAGGGPAGITAAVACARRRDVKTILIEKNHFLGGALADECGVPVEGAFPGYVSLGGLMDEVLAKVRFAKEDSAEMIDLGKRGVVYYHEPEYVKFLADDLLKKSLCQVMLDTAVVDVIKKGERILGVIVSGHMKAGVIWADVVLDCTGNADIARRSGCPMQEPVSEWRALPYRLTGVDFHRVTEYLAEDEHMKAAVRKAQADYTEVDENDCLWHLQGNVKEKMVYADTVRVKGDGAEAAARRKLWTHINFFRQYIPGMEHCALFRASRETMLLEKPRIQGEKIYGFCSGQGNRSLEDGIVRISRDQNTCQELPYDILIPQGVSDLLVAGKSVSVDKETQELLHLGTLMVLGHAAGIAAGIMAVKKVSNRDVNGKLVKSLAEELGCDITGDKTRAYYGDRKILDCGR